MKNLISLSWRVSAWIFALSFLCTFNACKKETIEKTAQSNNTYFDQKAIGRSMDNNCLYEFGDVGVENGILVFTDYEQFENIRTCLREQVNAHNAWFDSQYGHLPPDEQQVVIEELGFDEFQPLTDFENALGFNSLRQTINAAVDIWLQADVLDFANDPDIHPVLEDEMRALINPESKVKIGGEIYDFDDDVARRRVAPGDCRRTHSDAEALRYADNAMFDVKVSIANYVVASEISTRVRSFQLNRLGGWRFARLPIEVDMGNTVRGNQCEGLFAVPNMLNSANRTALSTSFTTSTFSRGGVPFPMSTVVASCELWGAGAVANGNINVCL